VEAEMQKVIDLLLRAQDAAGPQKAEIILSARQMVRDVVVRLSLERVDARAGPARERVGLPRQRVGLLRAVRGGLRPSAGRAQQAAGEHRPRPCRGARARGLPVILDAKRNDIGSTAMRYAAAYLGPDSGPGRAPFCCDALTVTPFLGEDGIKPFTQACAANGKGIFVLVKTSNPSGAQVQDLRIEGSGETVAERLAGLVAQWGSDSVGESGYSSVGAVIGATHPDTIKRLRELMPQAPILLPGFGAQGATAGDARDAFDAAGDGALVNSSRGILYPCDPSASDFFDQVRAKAQAAREAIQRMIKA
jgi:orotidine 5'-phosphate decarboxylase subfamily 2